MDYIEEQLKEFDELFVTTVNGSVAHKGSGKQGFNTGLLLKAFLTQSLQGLEKMMKDKFRNIELAPDDKTIEMIYKTSGRTEAFGMGQGWVCKKIDEIIDSL